MANARQVVCQRCGAQLRAVAFLDLETDIQGEALDVYCGPCSKILEREALRSWATKWARGIAEEEHHENFFKILASVWEQGFAKARTFEEARAVFELSDNPFIAESELIDPLKQVQAHRPAAPNPAPEEPREEPEAKPAYVDEDDYYDKRPLFPRRKK